MLTLGFLLVLVLGTMGFSYYSVLDAKKSDVKSTAARVCSTILEDWKATGGKSTYDAVIAFEDEFDISLKGNKSPGLSAGLSNVTGIYNVLINYTNHTVILWYANASAIEPKMLNVRANWVKTFNNTDDEVKPQDSVTIIMYADN